MQNKLNKQGGFTLIEIIVVLIIVGILSAIALPNLFSNIAKSRGAQAVATLSGYKSPLEACLAAHASTIPNTGGSACTFTGQNLPTTTGNGFWTFSIATASQAQTAALGTTVAPAGTFAAKTATYTLVAKETNGNNTITLTRATNGTWSLSTGSASPYTGISMSGPAYGG